jgi:hypothetical protein
LPLDTDPDTGYNAPMNTYTVLVFTDTTCTCLDHQYTVTAPDYLAACCIAAKRHVVCRVVRD